MEPTSEEIELPLVDPEVALQPQVEVDTEREDQFEPPPPLSSPKTETASIIATNTIPSDSKSSTKSKSSSKSSSKKKKRKKSGPNLNLLNFFNLLGYLTSLLTSYLGANSGCFGGSSTAEISLKYQTLITPSATYVKYIWPLIFLFEGLFAVSQLLPHYRHHILVQEGIGSIFFLACVAQMTWSITFGYELMMASFLSMTALFLFLMTILRRQWTIVAEEMDKIQTLIAAGDIENEKDVAPHEDKTARPPRPAYWLLRFPFAVHAGWISTATPLMLCVLLVQLDLEPNYELWVGVITLPLLFGCCMGLLLREEPGAPSYVFPGVVAYACAGISWELFAPSNAVLTRHDEASISLMKNLTGFCAACLMVVIVSRCIALFLRDMCVKYKNKEETVEIDGVVYSYMKA